MIIDYPRYILKRKVTSLPPSNRVLAVYSKCYFLCTTVIQIKIITIAAKTWNLIKYLFPLPIITLRLSKILNKNLDYLKSYHIVCHLSLSYFIWNTSVLAPKASLYFAKSVIVYGYIMWILLSVRACFYEDIENIYIFTLFKTI